MQQITEHSATIKATLPVRDATKKQEIFYNPTMSSNRSISVMVLNSIENKDMSIALPLAGSGIRGIRFLKELKKGKLGRLFINDNKENFLNIFNENLKLNRIKPDKDRIIIGNEDAVTFLLNQHCEDFCVYFDYIDIDPFGSPNPFIPSAVMRIKRSGILAVTATDTAALTGTYPKVTQRKYWAKSIKNHMMHETGLRILLRKVQLHGIQFDKALIPILAYHKDHYFRAYFRCERGKIKCDELIKQHKYLLACNSCLDYKTSVFNHEKCDCGNIYDFAGPLWAGELFERKLLKKIIENNKIGEEQKFLEIINQENDSVGFHDLHVIGKKYKSEPKRINPVLEKLEGARTHFSPTGIKTQKRVKEIIANLINYKSP